MPTLTLVPPPTTLTHADARRLDGQLRRLAADTARRLDEIAALMRRAKAGEIHKALGFKSWTAYLADALAPLCQGQSRAERREIVSMLYDSGNGMSVRAIDATGAPRSAVADDVAQVSETGHLTRSQQG